MCNSSGCGGRGGLLCNLSVCRLKVLVWHQMLMKMLFLGGLVSLNAKGNDEEFSFDDVAVVRSLTFSCSASSGWRLWETWGPALFQLLEIIFDWLRFVFKHTNLIQMRPKDQKDCLLHKRSESDTQWHFSLHVWCRLESSVYQSVICLCDLLPLRLCCRDAFTTFTLSVFGWISPKATCRKSSDDSSQIMLE